MAQIMVAFNLNGIDFEGISTDRSRLSELADWLGKLVAERPLSLSVASADASFRSYYRARTATHSYIVMDAPPPQEDTAPFHAVARTLRDAGIAAPKVLGWSVLPGFMLLEDFGNTTLLSCFEENNNAHALNAGLYRAYEHALDVVAHMQAQASPSGLPVYDEPFLRQEMELFRRWLVHRHLNLSWSRSDELEWQRTTQHLVNDALDQPRVFVHRDYHSRNLMLRDSLAADSPHLSTGASTGASKGALLGVLDFQDAMHGPVFYDVVSLLKDCYVTLDHGDLDRLLTHYFARAAEAGVDVADTDSRRRQFHAMGIQRHLKAAGIFARLWHRDGKSGYLKDIPRTLSYIIEAGQHDSRYAWCSRWIQERIMPRLKSAEHPH